MEGPLVDWRVSSPRLAITKLALTDTPEPELDPRDAERDVSYGLAGLPAHVERWYPDTEGSIFSG